MVKEPVCGHFSGHINDKWLTYRHQNSSENSKEIAFIDHWVASSSCREQSRSNQETDFKSLRVNNVIGRKIHNGINQKRHNNGWAGVGFGKVVHFGQFSSDRDDSVIE